MTLHSYFVFRLNQDGSHRFPVPEVLGRAVTGVVVAWGGVRLRDRFAFLAWWDDGLLEIRWGQTVKGGNRSSLRAVVIKMWGKGATPSVGFTCALDRKQGMVKTMKYMEFNTRANVHIMGGIMIELLLGISKANNDPCDKRVTGGKLFGEPRAPKPTASQGFATPAT
ncbi:hypothetical protein FA15DRAFT_656816 [Coprinopsis marcescibilis]|uniref:Uncharacterized protein n=1 Tax=Coprinopsis marcescibilis TaxID=230819 RepID=A0A5C3KS14_COPMA|nr:hypothetical protein FA15DRAFT_656816 [Coprinopsis marcescibilis]